MKNTSNGRKQNSSISEKDVTNIMSPQHIFPSGHFPLSSPSPPRTSCFQNTGARARTFARTIPSSRQKTSRGLLEAILILGDKARQEGGGRAGAATLSPPPFPSQQRLPTYFLGRWGWAGEWGRVWVLNSGSKW